MNYVWCFESMTGFGFLRSLHKVGMTQKLVLSITEKFYVSRSEQMGEIPPFEQAGLKNVLSGQSGMDA